MPSPFRSVVVPPEELVDAPKHKAAPGDHSLPEPTIKGEGMDSELVGQRIIAEPPFRLEFPKLDDSIVLHIKGGYQMYTQPSMNL